MPNVFWVDRTRKASTAILHTQKNHYFFFKGKEINDSDTSHAEKVLFLFQGQRNKRQRYFARRKSVISFSRTRKSTIAILRTQKKCYFFFKDKEINDSDTSHAEKALFLFQGQGNQRQRYFARRKSVISFSRTRKSTTAILRDFLRMTEILAFILSAGDERKPLLNEVLL
ncbi:hypothetical protein [Virgibacillus proomii]|uniref:hypothetical protein n=1 Tax=Virgibacillus proomii TaxID=84407 RepID=UPI001C112A84|nr:hypothetical protein [Virgibacillus proomii]MBU5266861.1 hypothetical protein [Virgibacillus proomii]